MKSNFFFFFSEKGINNNINGFYWKMIKNNKYSFQYYLFSRIIYLNNYMYSKKRQKKKKKI